MSRLRIALAPLLCLAACSAEPPCDPDTPSRFEGVWSGFEVGREDREWTLLVTGDCIFLSARGPGGWLKGAASFAPQGTEGPLDLRIDACDCPFEGQTTLARFRLKGDELQIAGGEPGSSERPSSFTAGTSRVLRLWRQGTPGPPT